MFRNPSRLLLATVFGLSLLAEIGCSAVNGGGIPSRPDNLGTADVDFNVKKPERWVLPNGLTVLYLQDSEVPLVSGALYFPGGQLYEPKGLEGIASATGSQMREGSIDGYSPKEFDQLLDQLGASVEAQFGAEFGSVSFSSLAEDFDQIFKVFAQVVFEPKFDAERLKLWKLIAAEGIRRRRDDPGTMASMAFEDLVYGESSPYATSASFESIARITPEEMRRFQKRFVQPQNAILIVTGAVSRAQLEKQVEKYFAKWASSSTETVQPPEVSHQLKPGIYVLERDFDQATVVMGHLGPPRLTKDHFPINIYNRLFGSAGFESTLFSEVRSRLGLAYAIDGGLEPGTKVGTFTISLATRNEEVARAIDKVLELTKQSVDQTPPAELVQRAKTAVKRSFVFAFADSKSTISRAAYLEILKYPPRFDEEYLKHVSEVWPDSIHEAAKRWVKPSDLAIVVVGRVRAEDLAKVFGGRLPVYRIGFDTAPKFESNPVRPK